MQKKIRQDAPTGGIQGFPRIGKAGERAATHVAAPMVRRRKVLDGRAGISPYGTSVLYHHLSVDPATFDEAGVTIVYPVRRGTQAAPAVPADLHDSLKTSLLRRVGKHIAATLGKLSLPELMQAVEAATPADTVARILSAAPDVGMATETGWTQALLRGAAAKQRMLERCGGSLTSTQAARLLGISVQAVKQRIERRAVLAVPLAGGAWGFPAAQFGADGRVRGGVAEVVKAAAGMNSWVLLSILADPAGNASRPVLLEALEDRAVREGVLARIATYGEHAAA